MTGTKSDVASYPSGNVSDTIMLKYLGPSSFSTPPHKKSTNYSIELTASTEPLILIIVVCLVAAQVHELQAEGPFNLNMCPSTQNIYTLIMHIKTAGPIVCVSIKTKNPAFGRNVCAVSYTIENSSSSSHKHPHPHPQKLAMRVARAFCAGAGARITTMHVINDLISKCVSVSVCVRVSQSKQHNEHGDKANTRGNG